MTVLFKHSWPLKFIMNPLTQMALILLLLPKDIFTCLLLIERGFIWRIESTSQSEQNWPPISVRSWKTRSGFLWWIGTGWGWVFLGMERGVDSSFPQLVPRWEHLGFLINLLRCGAEEHGETNIKNEIRVSLFFNPCFFLPFCYLLLCLGWHYFSFLFL